jgi:hypothetical protein
MIFRIHLTNSLKLKSKKMKFLKSFKKMSLNLIWKNIIAHNIVKILTNFQEFQKIVFLIMKKKINCLIRKKIH